MVHIRRAFEKASALVVPPILLRSSLFQSKSQLARFTCRPCLRPAPFLAFVISLTLLVQTSALPIPVAFLFISADADAVTEGCETKTCCTALCYVDEHGVHHCVHKHSDSCTGRDSADESDVNPVLVTTLATAPETEYLLPSLDPIGWIFHKSELETSRYPTKPSPPPK
jgi:hypothetical protein